MSYYNPDNAVAIKITNKNGETHYRIFGGWLSSYLYGSSYRVNSGVTKVFYDDKYFYFEGESGSIYKCRKVEAYFNQYCSNVLEQLCNSVRENGGSVEVIDMLDVEAKLSGSFNFEEFK